MDPVEHERLARFEEWYWWHRGRQALVERIVARDVEPHPRILDVGCGTGATTLCLRRFGPVLGLEIAPDALRRARARGLDVVRASADRLPTRPASFDLVVALDVLEHLDDDVAAAREMCDALRPGGRLLVTVPAYRFLWSAHDEALGHRRRYRRGGLASALRRAGLEVEYASYAMGSILPAAIAVRLWERWVRRTPARRESGYVTVPRPLNELLAAVTAAEGRLPRALRAPFGLSIVALARRPSGAQGR